MSFIPISQAISAEWATIRLIATDMDGTLTQTGKFTPQLLRALQELAQAKVPVVIVTGRSAGWVQGIASYLPIVGAIAENGGIYYTPERDDPQCLVKLASNHRRQLMDLFHQLQDEFPQIQESSDNRFRLTDWTFDVGGLSLEDLQQMGDRCRTQGWGFTYSTVQCHLKLPQQTKANALEQVMGYWFPHLTSRQVVTVGDSPNDESLFDASRFPHSVGVANSQHYREQLVHQPTYVTDAAEAEGFCELVRSLLNSAGTVGKKRRA